MRTVFKGTVLGALAVSAGLLVACDSGNSAVSSQPTSLFSSDETDATAADGLLKADAPVAIRPVDRATVDSVQPTLEWQNARGRHIDAGFRYELELYEGNDLAHVYTAERGSGDETSFEVPDALNYGTVYRWRVRAKYLNAYTPFSATADFTTPAPISAGRPPVQGGVVGPARSISLHEALAIAEGVQNALRYNLADDHHARDFWITAVAVIHYGHYRFNPSGPDWDWCIKDAGGGRPTSNDTLVSCSSRHAWDMGAFGVDAWHFGPIYDLGILPGEQNVYAPPLSALPN